VLPPTELLELLRADGARALGSRRGRPDRHRDLWSVVVAAAARGEALADAEPLRAIALVDDAAGLARAAGAWFVDGVARVTSASLHARHGDPLDALPVFGELVEHWRRSGSWPQQWTTLRNLAELLVRVGADDAAVAVVSGVRAHQGDTAIFGTESARLVEAMATARRRLGSERFELVEEQGAAMSRQHVVDHALAAVAGALAAATDVSSRPTR
jgi:hypothetical protein